MSKVVIEFDRTANLDGVRSFVDESVAAVASWLGASFQTLRLDAGHRVAEVPGADVAHHLGGGVMAALIRAVVERGNRNRRLSWAPIYWPAGSRILGRLIADGLTPDAATRLFDAAVERSPLSWWCIENIDVGGSAGPQELMISPTMDKLGRLWWVKAEWGFERMQKQLPGMGALGWRTWFGPTLSDQPELKTLFQSEDGRVTRIHGGVVLQLTHERFDSRDASHVDAILSALEDFDLWAWCNWDREAWVAASR